MAKQKRRVLVIGDIHEPFTHKEYFNFVKSVQKQYKTNHTVFIGDVMDAHAVSRHDHDPDGYSAGHELQLTINKLKRWHKAFPNADVVIGNHDTRVQKRMYAEGVPTKWFKSFADVLEVPTWNFALKHKIDDVLYIHGEGVTARTKAQRSGCSVVQGHRHMEGYVWFIPTEAKTLFGVQVGCGVDEDSYAMAYAKNGPPSSLSCAVIVDGTLPVVIPMV